MSKENLSIFVCSDFHAYEGEASQQGPPSWFNIQASGKYSVCPVAQLLDFIQKNNCKADLAVFCGDLSDKAVPVATIFAWEKVQEISAALGAEYTIATSGNHDMDSRFVYNDYDAKGVLQSLDPGFPTERANDYDHYWSRHFYFLNKADTFRILVLNSSAYHGFNDEYEHGRISSITLEQIKKTIREQKGDFPLNILVCHHPPQQQAEHGQGETDAMKGGDDLVEYLGELSSQWLIIYGHKHYPKLQYARGGVDAPILLSCGPISAIPYSEYGKHAKNQVHFVEFDLNYVRAHGMHGIVKTFEWAQGSPWRHATPEGGLPSICGFGNRNNSHENAQQISNIVSSKLAWDDLIKSYPAISFLPGNAFSIVLDVLDKRFGIKVDFNRDNEPIQIYRK